MYDFTNTNVHNRQHYNDVLIGVIASQITSLTIVYSVVYSDADQRKHQSSASLAFVRWIHRWPVNSPHKWPVTGKMFPFDDVIVVPWPCIYRLQSFSVPFRSPIPAGLQEPVFCSKALHSPGFWATKWRLWYPGYPENSSICVAQVSQNGFDNSSYSSKPD